ncbi:hypothetical protein [Bradyrhizobium sp. NC92]|uniref:hypothetical protein n=1 Tax=Bradyrhizobium sp. (strain NC92) TaxID=55395 RepID=UPI0021AAD1CE|nr:hypothetical protein [Bradyrhizobium sp. NC92]UWU72378.1 hypothetical protein N2602_18190 [Bradyrhizobium sp. NC92]
MTSFSSVLPIDSEAGFFVQLEKAIAMSTFRSRARCAAGSGRSSARRVCSYLLACILQAACVVPFASTASAQCAARDVLQNRLKPKSHSAPASEQPIRSARDVATWKTITIGTFANSLTLRNDLASKGCSVGGQAAEILARPAFTVSSQKTNVELVHLSPAQLGFTFDTVTLANVYARAQQVGLKLAAAEVGPQLRIQYFDQPVGEFLIIGMEPIKTWSGEPIILNVANGGAGLILIGQDGRAEADIPVTSRFIFVRSHQPAASSEVVGSVAAFLPP